jgi:hypothetical protein
MATQQHEVYGISFETPHIPPKLEIGGYELRKPEQKFRRVELPKSFYNVEFDDDGNGLYNDEQYAFIEQQQYHIEHGYWFYNYGEPTYITGLNYFYLNFWRLENNERPDYRDADRKWFYFQHYCESQKFIDGIIRVKKRREGATSQAACSLVYDAIMQEKAFCGIVSKSGKDAKDAFIYMVANGYKSLPDFLKVRCENENSKTELLFSEHGSKKHKKDKKKGQMFSDSLGLGSRIDWRATEVSSYDSGRLTKLLVDECFAKGTKILCEGFEFRNIEDIKVGDKVIIEGGKLMEVGKTCNGVDEMYLIKQPYSQDYVVNSKHRLYLEQRCKVSSILDDGIKIMTPVEAMNLDKYRKRTTHGVRSSGIDFTYKKPSIDPYLLGLWIGDGYSENGRWIVNFKDDPEILAYLKDFASQNGFRYRERYIKNNPKVVVISISDSNNRHTKNSICINLEKEGILNNKRIPKSYLLNSREVRLQVLAGIIDTDGYKSKPGVYCIGMARKELIEDISVLAKSLGFSVSRVQYAKTNFNTDSYLIRISGDIQNIPIKVERKKATGYQKQYAYRRNRIEVSNIGQGEYYGITLKADNDDDRRLILEDFTISMNCAKWPTETAIDEYWPIVQKTMKQGLRRVGFALMPSTTNRGEKGGTGFRKLWEDSNHNEGERTGSGMYRYFASADEGFEGYIDEYGMSILNKPTPEQAKWMRKHYGLGDLECGMSAREYILYKRSLIKNPVALKKEILDYPLSEKEAFDFSEDDNIYNTLLLNEQKDYLISKNLKFRKVRFYETHEKKVDFADDPNGDWLILYLPKEEERNLVTERAGKKTGGNIHKYVISVDPFKSTIKVGPGSKGAALIWSKPSELDPENTGMPVAMYYGRPKLRNTFHDQMMYAARYYGAELFYESDYDDYIEYFMNLGYFGYVKEKPKNAIDPNRKRTTMKQYGAKSADSFALSSMISASIEYVERRCHQLYFMELVEDLLSYDHDKRTDHDLAVAFQLGCLAIQAPIKQKKEVKKTSVLRTFDLTKRLN